MEEYRRAHPGDRGGLVTSVRAVLFAKAGDDRRARADVAVALEKGKGFVHFHHTAYNVASAYALLGDAGLAVRWLRVAAPGTSAAPSPRATLHPAAVADRAPESAVLTRVQTVF